MKAGYLYIIKCESWPTWVKIGTTMNLKKRLHVYQTSSPFRDYKIVYSIHHSNYVEAEKRVREIFKPFASRINHEWYEINLDAAREKLLEVLACYDKNIKP